MYEILDELNRCGLMDDDHYRKVASRIIEAAKAEFTQLMEAFNAEREPLRNTSANRSSGNNQLSEYLFELSSNTTLYSRNNQKGKGSGYNAGANTA